MSCYASLHSDYTNPNGPGDIDNPQVPYFIEATNATIALQITASRDSEDSGDVLTPGDIADETTLVLLDPILDLMRKAGWTVTPPKSTVTTVEDSSEGPRSRCSSPMPQLSKTHDFRGSKNFLRRIQASSTRPTFWKRLTDMKLTGHCFPQSAWPRPAAGCARRTTTCSAGSPAGNASIRAGREFDYVASRSAGAKTYPPYKSTRQKLKKYNPRLRSYPARVQKLMAQLNAR